MKKSLVYILLLLVFAAIIFGAGMGLAEVRVRFFSSQKTTIIPKNDAAPEVLNRPEENISSQESSDVPPSEEAQISPEAEKSFSFGILGDSQYFKAGNPNGGLQKAVRNMQKENPSLVFAVGDLISSCDTVGECTPKYAEWKKATAPFSGKIYAMQGNHDRTGKDKADSAWAASFNFPTNGPAGYTKMVYSFDRENSHFVVLDSDKPKEYDINDVQRQWLEQDLTRNKQSNTFVFFHEPAYPVSSKIGESLDVNGSDRNDLWNILVRHKVTAVFSGHEHIFSRKQVNGVYQFVVGNTDSFNHDAPKPGMAEYSYVGQHYVIVDVDGKKITVKLYSVDGKLINSFDFQK